MGKDLLNEELLAAPSRHPIVDVREEELGGGLASPRAVKVLFDLFEERGILQLHQRREKVLVFFAMLNAIRPVFNVHIGQNVLIFEQVLIGR